MAVNENRLKTKATRADDSMMPFTKENYILLSIGILIILVAYILMAVDNQVDGWISLYLAPYMLVFGYAELVFAIMYNKNGKKKST